MPLRRSSITLFIATIILINISVSVQASQLGPGIAPEDAAQIMPISQVKPGMKGYGLTVFQGTKIEQFSVEVIGVLKKVNLGKDLILVKMTGGPISARGANIIQGMSGSPVYINGKMIGAVAYGEAFAKEPLGMLTPVEDMLEALDPSLPARPSGYSSDPVTLSNSVGVDGRSINSVRFSNDAETAISSPDTLSIVPLGMPVMVSGMSARGLSGLQELLGPYNLRPMAGPGSTTKKEDVDLVPGAAVGVALATGDIEITGVGTLTYRRGNKVVAFGHPMLGIGAIDAPMTTAYVHAVFPSVMVSSKIASAMEIKGRIFQDRPWSIGGEIGKNSSLIPIKVFIDDQTSKRRRTVNVEVINHPLLAPRLIGLIAGEAIYELHPTPGDATAMVKLEIDADKIGKIERENIVFDPVAVDTTAIQDLQKILALLSSNKFHPIDVKSVSMSVTIAGGRNTATLERISMEKTRFEPGEIMDVDLLLRPYKKDPVVRRIQVAIPEQAPVGQYSLQVRGGGQSDALPLSVESRESEGIRIVSSGGGAAEADNVQQLVKKFLEQEKNNEVVARLLLPTSAVIVAGEKLSKLPAPLASIIRSNRATAFRMEREEIKSVSATEYIIGGSQTLQFTVQRPGQVDAKGPRPPSSATPPEPPSASASPPKQIQEPEDSENEPASISPQPTAEGAISYAWSRLNTMSAKPTSASVTAEEEVIEKDSELTEATPFGSPTPGSKLPEKPVARQPLVWNQSNYADFSMGTFDGASATTQDDIRISAKLTKIAASDQSFAWSVVPDGNGGAYVGTGPNGQILRKAKNGTVSVIHDSDEVMILCLLKGAADEVYAGTSPNGQVLKIAADGKAQVVFDAEEKHITAMVKDSNGDIFAGAGDSGTIYKIANGKGEKFVTLPDPELVSMTIDTDDNLYAGTGPNGIVYMINSDGQVSPVYDAAEPYAAAVAVNEAGDVFVGTAPKGLVYKIPKQGIPKVVLEKSPGAITSLAASPVGIYAATEGQVILIQEDDRVMQVDTGISRAQFTSLALDDSGVLYAGSANPAAVYSSENSTITGTYESPVYDAKLSSKWGTVSWAADLPVGTAMSIQTRTGDNAIPDASWSEWSEPCINAEGDAINSPSARFIQYRATLYGTAGATPVLKSVSVVYLPSNQAPKVNILAPQGQARWSGNQIVRWSGTDPDKDMLIYDVYYSSDGGETWKALRKGVVAKADTKAEKEQKSPEQSEKKPVLKRRAVTVDEKRVEERLRSEIESDYRIPREMKDKILAEVPELAKAEAAEPLTPLVELVLPDDENTEEKPEPSKETSYKWDTTKVPDGRYLIKVIASDRTSNAEGYLTAEKISEPVVVINKSPKVVAFKKLLMIEPDKSVVLPGYSYQTLAEIAGVEYRIGEGEWTAAAADDGIFDSPNEAFTVHTLPLDPGEHTIEVKAIDRAGNAATTKVDVKVE